MISLIIQPAADEELTATEHEIENHHHANIMTKSYESTVTMEKGEEVGIIEGINMKGIVSPTKAVTESREPHRRRRIQRRPG